LRYFEIASIKPKTPQQQRLATLKRTADAAKAALQRERKAQQLQKAHMRLHDLAAPKILP